MTKVRCKVRCDFVGTTGEGENQSHNASFSAVYDNDPTSENGQFFKWTPALQLSMSVLRGQYFEPGKEYYLDFVPAEVEASA